MVRFRKRGKLSPRCIKPFKVLQRVGEVSYQLVLPSSLSGFHVVFHVSMLRKYTLNPTHAVDWGELIIDADGTFEEGPIHIMDSRDQVLQCKTMRCPVLYGSEICASLCVIVGKINNILLCVKFMLICV